MLPIADVLFRRAVNERCRGAWDAPDRLAARRWALNRESPIVGDGVRGTTRWEVVMRAVLYVSAQTLMALINMASCAVVLGSLAAIYTQSLRMGLVVAGTALLAGGLGFAYSIWVLYRPRSRRALLT